jgi:hypothetical protein
VIRINTCQVLRQLGNLAHAPLKGTYVIDIRVHTLLQTRQHFEHNTRARWQDTASCMAFLRETMKEGNMVYSVHLQDF